MSITIDGSAGVTFPDNVQQTNGMTMTGGAPLYYAARAWVNFNGTTGAIRASVNVSSVTRTSTGNYTLLFSTAMPDANYCVIATVSHNSSANASYSLSVNEGINPTTTQLRLLANSATADVDPEYCNVVIFR